MMSGNERVAEALSTGLEDLGVNDASIPVDVLGMCRQIGIRVEVKDSVVCDASGDYSRIELDHPPRIVVCAPSGSSREATHRYTLAHELAHWVLWRRLELLPSSYSEYWQIEALCNAFASEVLLPTKALRRIIADHAASGKPTILLPRRVEKLARVSWVVAAKSITTRGGIQTAFMQARARLEDGSMAVEWSSVPGDNGTFVGEKAKVEGDILEKILGSDDLQDEKSSSVSVRQLGLEQFDPVLAPSTFKRAGTVIGSATIGSITLTDVACEYVASFRNGRGGIDIAIKLDDPGLKIRKSRQSTPKRN